MRYRNLVIVALMVVSLMLGAVVVTGRAQPENGPSNKGIIQKLDEKLEEVLNNQSKILNELEDMKKDLYIIKIRSGQI